MNTRLVVLISGNGSNLQAVIDACRVGGLPAQVVAVISNKSSAYGLARARQAGIPAVVKAKPKEQDRKEYDAELAALVQSYAPDWVVLAGWMRVLSMEFLGRFPNHVVNLHPALPGAFPGIEAIERAFESYQRGEIAHTGVMIHLVPDEGVDVGPVLAQEIVPIQPADTLESLAARIHGVEHRLLVQTLRNLIVSTSPYLSPIKLCLYPVQKLRYGENPHQTATLYSLEPGVGPLGGKFLQGKELSYTNLLDLDLGWRVVTGFERPTIAIIRQVSPCGIASAELLSDAFSLALASDVGEALASSVSGSLASSSAAATGAVVASNRLLDAATVTAMGNLFIECLIAPGYTEEARDLLARRKYCCLIEMPDLSIEPRIELRSIAYGVIKQDVDFGDPAGSAAWRVVSDRQPSEDEWAALRFAWKACIYVRSNAIVLARGAATIGIGGGQPNRADCVRVALLRAGGRAAGAVMASDAFFPSPDAVELAAQAGVTAVVHPGGSVRDQDALDAANRYGMAMLLTGVRHFKH